MYNLRPSLRLREELQVATLKLLDSGQFIGGEAVGEFERQWADYCGVEYCVGCASGFDALVLILKSLDFVDSVGVPAWTAPPVWAAILAAGKELVPDKAADAYLAVHLYGGKARAPKLPKGTILIEDCSQAHGGQFITYDRSIAQAWSFYPTKNLGAYGDAGAITTNDPHLAIRVRELADYATPGGMNSRLDSLQAAFLSVKLPYLDTWNRRRKDVARKYSDAFLGLQSINTWAWNPWCVWHQYVIVSNQRDELREFLANEGIETLIHYGRSPARVLKLEHFYSEATDYLAARVLSLPLNYDDTMVDLTIDILRRWDEENFSR